MGGAGLCAPVQPLIISTTGMKQTLKRFYTLANHYPSPHNGQPIRLKQTADDTFELYFDRNRGLQASDVSFIFSFVSMGVFVEHLSLVAGALGHGFSYKLQLPSEKALRGDGTVRFATCTLAWDSKPADDALRDTLLFRQTSRKKYVSGIPEAIAHSAEEIADAEGMSLHKLNPAQASQAIWLNQRAVFDDMFDDATRRELDHWLRYTHAQKTAMKDGLAYDCMELNGTAMRLIVSYPDILRLPGLSKVLRSYYLRTMKDDSDVFYMMAPFGTEQASFNVGLVIMRIWRLMAENGLYLHPFGTIMSNHAAHEDFLGLAGERHESRERSYLVFIFRGGVSQVPVRSERIPCDKHLVME